MGGITNRFDAAGVDLRYRLIGSGPRSLVCIHGVGSYLEAWDDVAGLLGDRFTILTFDLRGHGRSARVSGRYEMDDFVRETIALADHVGFGRFHLAGFSLGGLIAQQIALSHPDRIDRLVLLSTVAGRNAQEKAQVLERLALLQTAGAQQHHDTSLSRWLTERFQDANPDRIAELRRRDAENDRDCYAAAYRVLATTDLGDQLEQIRVPTLIVTGEDDVGSSPRMARFMHERIAGSALSILPDLRHSILVEAPALVAARMATFLMEEDHG
jgi:pimeloyl-ACP methyl ester carboxylesterase